MVLNSASKMVKTIVMPCRNFFSRRNDTQTMPNVRNDTESVLWSDPLVSHRKYLSLWHMYTKLSTVLHLKHFAEHLPPGVENPHYHLRRQPDYRLTPTHEKRYM